MDNLIIYIKDALVYFKPKRKQYEELLNRYRKYSKTLFIVYSHLSLNKLFIALLFVGYARLAFVQIANHLSFLYDSKYVESKIIDVAATAIRKNSIFSMDIKKMLFVYGITIAVFFALWFLLYLLEIPIKKILFKAMLVAQEHAVRKTADNLYEYYDGFYYKYGYVCPLKSFQYCHPDEIDNIYKILVSGTADDIVGAKALLKKEGHLKDFSFLDMWNKNDYETKKQSDNTEKENHQSTYNDFENQSRADEKKSSTSSKSEDKKQNENGSNQKKEESRTDQDTLEWKINHSTHFRGIKSDDELKSRYRSLAKIYHEDSGTGDGETTKQINIEYNDLKQWFEKLSKG